MGVLWSAVPPYAVFIFYSLCCFFPPLHFLNECSLIGLKYVYSSAVNRHTDRGRGVFQGPSGASPIQCFCVGPPAPSALHLFTVVNVSVLLRADGSPSGADGLLAARWSFNRRMTGSRTIQKTNGVCVKKAWQCSKEFHKKRK